MNDTVEFRWAPRPLGWLAALLLLVSVLGLLMLAEADIGTKVLGGIWTGLFLWGAWALLRRVFDREPVVIVSPAGIRDRRIKDTFIPWLAISRIEAFSAEHVPFIGLEFHDPKSALADAKPMMRYAAPVQRFLRFPSTSMQMTLLDGSGEDVLAAIRRFAPGIEIVTD